MSSPITAQESLGFIITSYLYESEQLRASHEVNVF